MKNILTVLLFCFIIENILSSKQSLKMKMAKVSKTKKDISTLKQKNLRKEEITDKTDDFDFDFDSDFPIDIEIDNSTSSEQNTTTESNSTKIIDTQPEYINATAENYNVNSTKPVSLKLKITEKKDAKVQFINFFGFKATNISEKVTFGIFLYFRGRTIAERIAMRLRINYFNLKDIAESARTVCEIANYSFAGTFASDKDGNFVKYNCEVNATLGNANSANYILNSDVPLILVNENNAVESLDFSELNFNGNSVSESNSIHNNSLFLNGKVLALNGSVASTDKYILKLTGETDLYERLLRRLHIVENLTITMNFLDKFNNVKMYNCSLNLSDYNDIEIDEIICNTSGNPINTTSKRLHLSPGTSQGFLAIIKMKDINSESIISTYYNEDKKNGYIPPPVEEYTDKTSPDQAEKANATVEDYTVNSDKPVSQKGYTNDNKSAEIHIMKFHSFQKRQGKINFGTIFYFIGKTIPYSILYRLRITYNSRLRNLQAGTAESVRTDCVITNENLAETIQNDGVNVNYDCSANATRYETISNIQLNTDANIVFAFKNGTIDETIDFDKVSFNGNASNESKNIQEYEEPIINQAYLMDTNVSIEKYILKFTGIYYVNESFIRLRRLALREGETISMNFKTKRNNQDVTIAYNCEFYQSNNDNDNADLECDTSKNPINTNVENLHLSNGISDDGILLTIEMNDWQNNKSQIAAQNPYFRSKSSSGLSGGAIAGIVIAGVVVLSAVSIFTIFALRKPKTPLNNIDALNKKNDSSIKVIK